MNDKRLKGLILPAAVAITCAIPWMPGRSIADTFTDLMRESQTANAAAQASQTRVDQADARGRALLREFRAVTRQSANLDAYNAHLERQIARQEQSLAALDRSIADITGFQRDLLPLTARMLDALERFVGLDLPFHASERHRRIAALRAQLDDPAVPVADKFRRVLDALRDEIGYGNSVESWSERIALAGGEQEATLLRVGRIALLARTGTGTLARWDPATRAWQPLDADHAEGFDLGLQAAHGELPPDLLRLPLPAPVEPGK